MGGHYSGLPVQMGTDLNLKKPWSVRLYFFISEA